VTPWTELDPDTMAEVERVVEEALAVYWRVEEAWAEYLADHPRRFAGPVRLSVWTAPRWTWVRTVDGLIPPLAAISVSLSPAILLSMKRSASISLNPNLTQSTIPSARAVAVSPVGSSHDSLFETSAPLCRMRRCSSSYGRPWRRGAGQIQLGPLR
jgi:hypothetical protein